MYLVDLNKRIFYQATKTLYMHPKETESTEILTKENSRSYSAAKQPVTVYEDKSIFFILQT